MAEEKNLINQDYELLVRKSNALVSAKYKSTILENKILAIALTRIERTNDGIVAKLYPGEIRQLLGSVDDTNIYRKLKAASKVMTGHSVIIEDGNGNFSTFAMIPNAEYKDKVFSIYFNKEMEPHIMGLRKNYTTFKLATLMMFEKNNSYRIYEVLRKEMYRSQENINDGCVVKEYDVNEFKCIIGLVNMDEEGVRRAVAAGKSWDDIYEKIAKERQYPEWRDFQRKVLQVAQKELNEKADIRFEYKGIRMGKGAKIRRITFYIYWNTVSEDLQEQINTKAEVIQKKADQFEQMNMFDSNCASIYKEFIGHNSLMREDLDLLLQAANYNEEVVRNAIYMADRQPAISNYMGWILSCINNKYREPIEVVDGSTQKAEVVKEIKEATNDPAIHQRVWEKATANEDYAEFEQYVIQEYGDMSTFDVLYDSYKAKFKQYADWKTKRSTK